MCTMSENGRVGRSGPDGSENRLGLDIIRAAVHRGLVGTLTIGMQASARGGISPAGLSHSVGVCMLEMAIMARGKGKAVGTGSGAGMPTFVDVKLTAEDRERFLVENDDLNMLGPRMQILCDAGYRWGCAWNGETQSYTVSLTCRDQESPNAGLCMTSFAKDLVTAVRLSLFKHEVVTGGDWTGGAGQQFGAFG